MSETTYFVVPSQWHWVHRHRNPLDQFPSFPDHDAAVAHLRTLPGPHYLVAVRRNEHGQWELAF